MAEHLVASGGGGRRPGWTGLLVVPLALLVAAVSVVVVRSGADADADVRETVVEVPVVARRPMGYASTNEPSPRPVVPRSTPLASPNGEIPTYDGPDGAEVGRVGVWYGYPMTMPIVEEQGDWLRIMMPERPNMMTAWVRRDQVTLSASSWRIVLDLSDTRVYVYDDGREVWSAPVGIGRDSTRTPTGSYFVAVIEKPGPSGYGPVVLDLNAHSEDIESWQGSGDAITAFHGPFGSQDFIRAGGGKVSNGCIRMLPEDQLKLEPITLGSPVDIVA